jgi:hypothetical protein
MITVQQRLGEVLFAQVAGSSGPANRERFRSATGPR